MRGGFVFGEDAGVGERAAQEGDVPQVGEADIGDELAAAGEVAGVFLAAHARADAGGRGVGGVHFTSPGGAI